MSLPTISQYFLVVSDASKSTFVWYFLQEILRRSLRAFWRCWSGLCLLFQCQERVFLFRHLFRVLLCVSIVYGKIIYLSIISFSVPISKMEPSFGPYFCWIDFIRRKRTSKQLNAVFKYFQSSMSEISSFSTVTDCAWWVGWRARQRGPTSRRVEVLNSFSGRGHQSDCLRCSF